LKNAFRQLDSLLRGGAILSSHDEQAAEVGIATLTSLKLTLLLGAVYGACMGLFALSGGETGAWLQLFASALKLPLLFLLTLLVSFPALYVFSVLAGSALYFSPLLRVMLASILVMVAVSASLAPILAFFTVSTTSYSFMVLLNVALLGIAGLIGLNVLRKTLLLLLPAAELGARKGAATHIFRLWLLLFALVGGQMAWLLRPFIGKPHAAFTWFRPREASFFQSVFEHLIRFLGSG
jgi:hypothetical protein